jgi:hypothetical protein
MFINNSLRVFVIIALLFLMPLCIASQNAGEEQSGMQRPDRGSIPEELLRPRRGELPRYPADTVIGELGRGSVSRDAYSFANTVASGLLSGQMNNAGIDSINAGLRESYLAVLELISPQSYRIGGGREEADGAVSFLIRFIGKEQGIMGELFIRLQDQQREQKQGEEVETRTARKWVFEELILEEAKSRDAEQKELLQRFDFSPYERFF